MNEVEKCALFDQFHDQTELRRFGDGSNHKYDVGVPIFCEHIYFVCELI
jgi:hypothetical protein